MSEKDMISTFLKTLGPTYQLMLLTASQGNFAEVINKAAKIELAIKAGLVQDAPPASTNFTRSVPKKAIVTHPKVSIIQAIEVPQPGSNSGYIQPQLRAIPNYPVAMNVPPQAQPVYQ